MNASEKKSGLWFDAKQLSQFQECIDESELKEGETYFTVYYLDDEMLVPQLTPVTFIGRQLDGDEPEDTLYFQDYDSYRQGLRWPPNQTGDSQPDVTGVRVTITSVKSSESTDVCSYEQALDSILKCALRRRSQKVSSK